jgi:hypothetical protein
LKYANVVQNLNKDQKETKQIMCLKTNSRLLELFTGASGHWTLLVVTSQGEACLMAAGQNWILTTNKTEASLQPDSH